MWRGPSHGLLCLVLTSSWGCPSSRPVVFLGAPGTSETHAVVTVQRSPAVAAEVWRLRSSAVVQGRSTTTLLPDQPPGAALDLPSQFTVVAKGRSGDLSLVVDGLGEDGNVVGRARGVVALVPQDRVDLALELLAPCREDPDCQDGVFCNGPERCVEGTCGPGSPPCGSGVECVLSRCEESASQCVLTLDPTSCGPGRYCDVLRGCLPGTPCSGDTDCEPLGNTCFPKRCESGRCVDGTPLNPDDGNPCTVDVCRPAEGVRHYDLAEGNVCSAPGEPRHVCRHPVGGGVLTCAASTCGDGFVDPGSQEECDLGPGNDDDTCTRACRMPRCGDGILSPSLLEECDDGEQGTDGDCVACRAARCGDGVVHRTGTPPLEQCDDGENNGLGSCDLRCRLTTFEVFQVMGVGAACPGTGRDGGAFPPADGGWNYRDAGAMVEEDTALDSRCVTLEDVQDLAFRQIPSETSLDPADELIVVDRAGAWAVNVRTLRAAFLFPALPDTQMRACQPDESTVWVHPEGGGLPGLWEGVDGLAAHDRSIMYRTRLSRRVLRVIRHAPPSGLNLLQSFAYTGGAAFSVADCCQSPHDYLWRNSDCPTCPGVTFHGAPRAFFDFVGHPFLLMPDSTRQVIHAADETAGCERAIVTFSVCALRGVDAGPTTQDDAGNPVLTAAARHAAPISPFCLGGMNTGMILSSPGSHQVLRAGLSLPQDLLARCLSTYDVVAGVAWQPGDGADNSLAREAPIHTPTGVGQDDSCNIYFADTGNGVVRRVTQDGRLHNVASLPGLRTLTVHPRLGVLASTATGIYRVLPRRED